MIAPPTLKIRRILEAEKLDAILIFGLPNMRYLSGFTGTDGVLLIGVDNSVFLTDSRYLLQAQAQVSTDQITCYKNKFKTIIAQLRNCGYKRVGFDAAAIDFAKYDELVTTGGSSFTWIPLATQLQTLRAIKSDVELLALNKAAALNNDAFDLIYPTIQPGMTERDVALELEFTLRRLGGEDKAFDFIVASGKRGALPHGVASEKKLVAGELITIDFGTRVDGYHSDETVTFALGEVDGKLRQIFDIVLEAHDTALAAIHPGGLICDLDTVARDIITAKGYGDYFGHGLGHGVGLEVHEYPPVSQRTDQRLEAGMVITIEPGIYVPELGGVRIEDTVVVTGNGHESITTIPKQFKQINT